MPYIGPGPTPNAPRDYNGGKLILDADQDTSVTADTDDQIDIEIAGADDFQFTANTFTVKSGSKIDLADGGSLTTSSAGRRNTSLGVNSGNAIVSGGNYNVTLGDEAGTALTTGDNNVLIGYGAGDAFDTESDLSLIHI